MVSRTLRMLRFRGKRIWYLVFAAFATFLIFRWSHESDPVLEFDIPIPAQKEENVPNNYGKPVGDALPPAQVVDEVKKTTSVPVVEITSSPTPSPSPTEKKELLETTSVAVAEQTPISAPIPNMPEVVLPDRQKPPTNPLNDPNMRPSDEQGRKEVSSSWAATTVHWTKQAEHFPVPTESIILLPTGPAVPIPRIQFKFKDETPDAKINREKRQSQVKAEFQKAWKGYREIAWLHDELSPVSGNFRDPFCGWAASLVDGLDTLFIMGMEAEFEEAVKAVGELDFTTSSRQDIPMFETTIRYLGGMIAAYDVSGQKHKVLLDKAVELADVMMGAFDTPNRQPILFYYWAPNFASQPHRASSHVNTAELGSMSLEFTRLAQLTKEPRYYDAVARISNALSKWQDEGTTGLDGVFPESIDASGCNRTEVSTPIAGSEGRGPAGNLGEHALGYQALGDKKDVGKPKPDVTVNPKDPDAVDLEIVTVKSTKVILADKTAEPASTETSRVTKREETQEKTPSESTTPVAEKDVADSKSIEAPTRQKPPVFTKFNTPSRVVEEDWDCKPQGLQASYPNGMNRYGMGGGQDSTYEYMPKQYLLLGGREQMYGKMYLKTMETVRKDFVFRAMLPTHRQHDLLFSGAIQTSTNYDEVTGSVTTKTLIPEVEHLTCFIGGMVGMGAKIFDRPDDLEMAKQLTEGCVWAYESFALGIMPEGSTVIPCEDRNDCPWSESFYRSALDPIGEKARDEAIAKYVVDKAKADEDAVLAANRAARKAEKEVEAREKGQDVLATIPAGGNATSESTPPQTTGTSIAEATLKQTEAPASSAVLNSAESSVDSSTPTLGESSIASTPSLSAEIPVGSSMLSSVETPIASSTSISAETPIASAPSISAEISVGSSTSKLVETYSISTSSSLVETPTGNVKSKRNDPVALQKRSEEISPEKKDVESKVDEPAPKSSDLTPFPEKSEPRPNQHLESLKPELPSAAATQSSSHRKQPVKSTNVVDNIAPSEREYDEFVRENEAGVGRDDSLMSNGTEPLVDPMMPPTHNQFVDSQIKLLNLPPGFVTIRSSSYILRPEAIESVWYMYRITGDPIWQDKGWKMFEAIINATSTTYGHSAIYDVTADTPTLKDEMESFWLAETLKYFYLLYSTPDVISLDEWVLNTEAHPFRRPEA